MRLEEELTQLIWMIKHLDFTHNTDSVKEQLENKVIEIRDLIEMPD